MQALTKGSHKTEYFARRAHRLSVMLCEASDILPSSLRLKDVSLLQPNALFGGGFADIYHASHHGKEVALKRMRVFQKGRQHHKIYRVMHILMWFK
jgi:hypothetical protein